MTSRAHLWIESLESRRLLSGEGVVDVVHHEAELFGATPGREPIYPPLAPAMWMEVVIGSFELPQEITTAFFAPDEPANEPVVDEPTGVEPIGDEPIGDEPDEPIADGEARRPIAPPPIVDSGEASFLPTGAASIAQMLFGEESPGGMDLAADIADE